MQPFTRRKVVRRDRGPVRRAQVVAAVAAVFAALVPAVEAATPTTTRESLSSSGEEGDGASADASISSDGRWVAFTSDATNLVPNDTNEVADVFLRDRLTKQTRRVSVGPAGAESDGTSELSTISDDGRYVVFRSFADTLVPGVASAQLYRYDREAESLIALPLPVDYAFPDAPSISADGSRVAFHAYADDGTVDDVFWWNAATGTVKRVSERTDGSAADGGSSFDPNISGDGHWVGFTTDSTDLVAGDANEYRDVLVRNVDTGEFTRVSVGSGSPPTEANLHSSTPAIDYDGCIVAFFSSATNLVDGDTGSQPKVFVRDRCAGFTELVSVTNSGEQATALTPIDISEDGYRVVFRSVGAASPPPTSGQAAILRDRRMGSTSRLDLATSGDPGTGGVDELDISGGTGRYVAFSSDATTLVQGDTKQVEDVFVRDLATNTPPVAALSISREDRTVTADASGSRDTDGFHVTSSISFGDGSDAQTGVHAVHTYTHGGTYGVLATVTDDDGASSTKLLPVTVPEPGEPPDGKPPPGRTPLRLDMVRLAKSRFAVVAPGGKFDRTHGSSLSLHLNLTATVTLRFERVRKGHRVNGRCSRRAHTGPRCRIYSPVGSFSRARRAGTSKLPVTGRVGSKTLAAGGYRLTVSARTGDGRRSVRRRLTFTIVRAGPHTTGGKRY